MRLANATSGLVLLALLLSWGCQRDGGAPVEEFHPRWHFLAAGDSVDGRQAFVDLECNTCHAVSGDPMEGANRSGPELGSMVAGRSADEIAVSIIAPTHGVSSKQGIWRNEKPEQMGDYSRVITVRQLMDLISYLRALRGDDHEEQTRN